MSGCPRTSKLESKVSPHIEEQLPEFVRSEHPLFATFVKHYYQFLEAGCLTLGGSNDYLAQETLTNNLILDNNDDKIVLESSVGKFHEGETIRGDKSGYTATILVDDYDSTGKLYISSQQKFSKGENVVGLTSGARAVITNYQGNPIQNIQQLLAYADIDNTVYTFFDKFKKSFLESLPESITDNIDIRNLIKSVKDLYEARGTEEGHKLFFRILFDQESSLLYPKDNMMKLSDGQWSTDYLMRVREDGNSDFSQLVGKTITGQTSGATAVVQSVTKFIYGADVIAELNLDRGTILGTFDSGSADLLLSEDGDNLVTESGEQIREEGSIGEVVTGVSNTLDLTITARVVGITNNISLSSRGQYYRVNDIIHFSLPQDVSVGVKGEVRSIGTGGITDVYVEDGGTGYTYNDTVTFNNANTNGVDAAANISVLGGILTIENDTYPDNIVLEGSSDHNKLIIKDVNGELHELQQEEQLGDNSGLLLENGHNIILESETLPSAQRTSIRKIRVTKKGNGYTKLPDVTITSSTGSNAKVLATTTDGIGRILEIQMKDYGVGYVRPPTVTFNKNVIVKNVSGTFNKGDIILDFDGTVESYDSTTQLLEIKSDLEHFTEGDPITTASANATAHQCVHAEATANNGAIVISSGDYSGLRGQLDEEQMKIQDSRFYQDYSYVVKVGESINTWRDSIIRSVHPAGWNVFGEVSIATSLAEAQLHSMKIRNPAAGDVIDFTSDTTTYSPELASTFRTLFSARFRRRLGTTDDGTTLNTTNPMSSTEFEDIWETNSPNNKLDNDNKRERTISSSYEFEIGVGGGIIGVFSPTLELLPKYAFSQPPTGTNVAIPHYPGLTRQVRLDDTNQSAYFTIGQFSQFRINQVSDSNGDIPETAKSVKINVQPPGEIILRRTGSVTLDDIGVTMDDTTRTFDDL